MVLVWLGSLGFRLCQLSCLWSLSSLSSFEALSIRPRYTPTGVGLLSYYPFVVDGVSRVPNPISCRLCDL